VSKTALRLLAWFYILAMAVSATCVIWLLSIRGTRSPLCMTVFVCAFLAGPWTAAVHVWLSPRVKNKLALTRKLCIGFDAYFAAYRYLLKGER